MVKPPRGLGFPWRTHRSQLQSGRGSKAGSAGAGRRRGGRWSRAGPPRGGLRP